jgi:N4-gp56 family major capsid protein
MPISATQADLESRRGLGTTYTFNFASDMVPGSTAISETTDIPVQVLRDATATITPTSRGEALKWSELLDLSVYTDYVKIRAEKIGENMMETVDNLAKAASLQGSLVQYGNMAASHNTRATLDAGTTTDNWTEANLWRVATLVQTLRCPPYMSPNGQKNFIAIAHPDAFYDLFHGGNVLSAMTYGGLPGSILLNGEIGMLAGFKLVISPWAKVFGGAGAVNGGGDTGLTYTVTATGTALSKSMTITTGTNVAYGRLLTVGTKETANTHYDTNERISRIAGTTTLTFVGSGSNGGLRFDHGTAEYVNNADTVYPVVYGGPASLIKLFASDIGEFGKLVGPKYDGLADQWQSLAWKYYGNYGRIAENFLARGEYSSSLDA